MIRRAFQGFRRLSAGFQAFLRLREPPECLLTIFRIIKEYLILCLRSSPGYAMMSLSRERNPNPNERNTMDITSKKTDTSYTEEDVEITLSSTTFYITVEVECQDLDEVGDFGDYRYNERVVDFVEVTKIEWYKRIRGQDVLEELPITEGLAAVLIEEYKQTLDR